MGSAEISGFDPDEEGIEQLAEELDSYLLPPDLPSLRSPDLLAPPDLPPASEN